MKNNEKNINNTLPILPTGAFSKALGVHQRTLQIYDKEQILCPKRTDKNRRLYTLNDLEKGKVILFLTRNLALNLSGVKIILAFLDKNKIEPQKRLEYLQNMAKFANITSEEQERNILKTSKRGRMKIND